MQQKLPYSGKVWWVECLANLLFSSIWQKKVWRMNRSAKGLSMVTTNLDGFSLANRRRFAKFAKLSPRQTFPLYGIYYHEAHQMPIKSTSIGAPMKEIRCFKYSPYISYGEAIISHVILTK